MQNSKKKLKKFVSLVEGKEREGKVCSFEGCKGVHILVYTSIACKTYEHCLQNLRALPAKLTDVATNMVNKCP